MGFCSQYLSDAATKLNQAGGPKIVCNAFVKASMFQMPENVSTPIVMVGPGTGLAPFIGFIEERLFLLE